MLPLFSPLSQTLICLFFSTPQANTSSALLTPLFQTLVGGILAIIGAIAGSIITGHFLIKSHKKAEIEKKV